MEEGFSKKVNGKKKALRSSQGYTEDFGEALHSAWARNSFEIVQDAIDLTCAASTTAIEWDSVLGDSVGHDSWEDARLDGVFDMLVADKDY